MRAILIVLIATLALSCSKEKIIDPVGLYNVTVNQNTQVSAGSVGIDKFNDHYRLNFSYATGLGGMPIDAEIVNRKVTIDSLKLFEGTMLQSVVNGTGQIQESGVINLNFSIKRGTSNYQYIVVGNRVK